MALGHQFSPWCTTSKPNSTSIKTTMTILDIGTLECTAHSWNLSIADHYEGVWYYMPCSQFFINIYYLLSPPYLVWSLMCATLTHTPSWFVIKVLNFFIQANWSPTTPLPHVPLLTTHVLKEWPMDWLNRQHGKLHSLLYYKDKWFVFYHIILSPS